MGPGDPFELDTQGICLLCLRHCSEGGGSNFRCQRPGPASSKDHAFKVFMRYLNIDLLQQCNFPPDFLHHTDGFQREVQMSVRMCSVCRSLCQQFSEVYRQFEMVRLQLDQCVQALYEMMVGGEQDPQRLRRFENVTAKRSWNPLSLFHASIADNLRKETLRKCSLRVEKLVPRVTVSKTDFYPGGAGYPGQSSPSAPICVITQTKGDLTKEDEFEGPMSLLKVETTFPDEISYEIVNFDHDDLVEPNNVKEEEEEDDALSDYDDGVMKVDPDDKPYYPGKGTTKKGGASGSAGSKCKYCNKRFFSPGNLRTHLLTVHTFDHFAHRLPAGTTPVLLKNALEHCVNQYTIVPQNEDPFGRKRIRCGFCVKGHRDTFNLRIHVLDNHFEEIISAMGKTPGTPPKIPPKVSKTKAAKTLSPTKTTKAFKRTGGGRGKSKVSNPLYKCSVCKKGFTVSACMRRHYKIFHTSDEAKKHRCAYCDKVFLTGFAMRLHTNTVHLFESNQEKLPVGVTKAQLKAVITKICSEQDRQRSGPTSKAKVKCLFCGKLNSDSFFFKTHLVESHFEEVLNRLAEPDAPNGVQEEGIGFEMEEEEEEMPIDSFQISSICDRLEENGDQEHDTLAEDNSSGPSSVIAQNGILAGLLSGGSPMEGEGEENGEDDEDTGSLEEGEIPLPRLDLYTPAHLNNICKD